MRLIGWLSAVVALMAVMLLVLAWVPANIAATRGERQLQQWAEKRPPDRATVSALCATLETTTAVHPLNAHYWYLQGKCLQWLAFVATDSPQAARDAQTALLRSATLRPSWPDTWLELAVLAAQQPQPGPMFLQYVANASRYGPYKPSVILGLVRLGLASWRGGRTPLPSYALAAIERGLRSSLREQIFRTAQEYQAGPLVCALWWRHHAEGWWRCGAHRPAGLPALAPPS